MLKIVKSRRYTISHVDEDGDISFSITYQFKPSEDTELKRIRAELEQKRDVNLNSELIDTVIREAIVDCEDIYNEEDMVPIKVLDDKGNPDPYIQKLLYDISKSFPEFFGKVLVAFCGVNRKNSKTGQTPVSTGSGDQDSASSAKTEPV